MRPIDPTDVVQLRVYAASLAPTPATQIAIIVNLLQHANEDEMTAIDRAFCRATLDLLRGDRVVA